MPSEVTVWRLAEQLGVNVATLVHHAVRAGALQPDGTVMAECVAAVAALTTGERVDITPPATVADVATVLLKQAVTAPLPVDAVAAELAAVGRDATGVATLLGELTAKGYATINDDGQIVAAATRAMELQAIAQGVV